MGLQTISEQFRRVIRYIGLSVVTIIGIILLWFVVSFFWKILFPPAPLEADLAFGKIKKPFVYNFQPKNAQFSLDTNSGQLNTLTNILPVYAIPAPEGKFVSLDESKKIAQKAGLDSEPTKLSEFEWRFTSQKNPSKSLKVNIVSKNFSYLDDWNTNQKVLEGFFQTNEETITKEARSYLANLNSLKDDLKNKAAKVSYWKLVGPQKNKVASFSEANAVLVELFRDDISFNKKTLPIFESNDNLSLINLLVGPKNLIELNFTYWNVEFSKFATYDLKTSEEAYDNLRKGNAYLPKNENLNFDSITITDIELGYLNPNSTTIRFMQPIFVFEGEGNINGAKIDFLAYVLALKDDYIK